MFPYLSSVGAKLHRFAIVLFLIGVPFASMGGIEMTNHFSSLDYEKILQCGPNSLFLFLLLTGHRDVTLEQVKDLPISREGASLLQLREAANKFNAAVDVRFLTSNHIRRMPLPAIAQFKTGPASITPVHFNVIYKVDDTFVHYINGTTGMKEYIRITRLPAFWTGYVMVPHSSFPNTLFSSVGVAVFITVSCATFLAVRGAKDRPIPS